MDFIAFGDISDTPIVAVMLEFWIIKHPVKELELKYLWK